MKFIALLCTLMLIQLQAELKPHPDAIPNTHAPGSNNKPDAVPFIVKDKNTLEGLVWDEMDAELVGEWAYSTHTPPYIGLGYLFSKNSGKGEKKVIYRPVVNKSGRYELRISHCSNKRRSTRALIKVKDAKKWSELRINQAKEPPHKRLFRTIGTFYFKAGVAGEVVISNKGTEADKVVIADAIQLLWIGE